VVSFVVNGGVVDVGDEGGHSFLGGLVLPEEHEQIIGGVLSDDAALEQLQVDHPPHSDEVLVLQPQQRLLQHLHLVVAESPPLEDVLLLPDGVVILHQDLQRDFGVEPALLVHEPLADEAEEEDVGQGEASIANAVLANKFLAMFLYYVMN
jgi:hypothetical protein